LPLNIKNAEVEHLAVEVANLAKETKTEAIRRALLERRDRLAARSRRKKPGDLRAFLEKNVWPFVPASEVGRRLTRAEEDEILGFGPEGV
jgi:antitoxin VapB